VLRIVRQMSAGDPQPASGARASSSSIRCCIGLLDHLFANRANVSADLRSNHATPGIAWPSDLLQISIPERGGGAGGWLGGGGGGWGGGGGGGRGGGGGGGGGKRLELRALEYRTRWPHPRKTPANPMCVPHEFDLDCRPAVLLRRWPTSPKWSSPKWGRNARNVHEEHGQ